MYRVITISREYGSGGSELARVLGRRLGWRLVDDDLIVQIAEAERISQDEVRRNDECVDPWFHRVLKALWHGGFEGAATRADLDPLDADRVANLWNRLALETAALGECVIVGRGGQCLLKGRGDTFHVAVYAPMSERIKRIREREPDRRDPEAAAHERDAIRAAYIMRHFGHDWTNRHLYHLMICSSVGLENAAEAILSSAGLGARSHS
jgi:cytidylate kinase